MTTEKLLEILDDENVKLSKKELVNVVYSLWRDCVNESYRFTSCDDLNTSYFLGYFSGEANAFRLVLDLLDHLK